MEKNVLLLLLAKIGRDEKVACRSSGEDIGSFTK
jgi:hypothetical protein